MSTKENIPKDMKCAKGAKNKLLKCMNALGALGEALQGTLKMHPIRYTIVLTKDKS